ncbi:unnamed protein product [Polarella glacialis]|uniref:Peptide-methionine (S)-S-oxide reductase n=1 Tax=Polarella glacialis TaxID=89957 RepID=A0A813FXM0_POLGL|nr:unnamed protein product [Polarella glacialis]
MRRFVAALLLAAASAEEEVRIYFGCGCFWHVQHELIKGESTILGRTASCYQSLTGYAGGTQLNAKGHTCYGDYTGLGHTEVVGLSVPNSSVAAFGAEFWKLFVGQDRVDTMDRGPAYRAAIGVPGGMASELVAVINRSQASRAARDGWWFRLEAGEGNDPDTLGKPLVWVYDTNKYPFYQAERYHQFHDDFLPGGDYDATYNQLYSLFDSEERMKATSCPKECVNNYLGVQCIDNKASVPSPAPSTPPTTVGSQDQAIAASPLTSPSPTTSGSKDDQPRNTSRPVSGTPSQCVLLVKLLLVAKLFF